MNSSILIFTSRFLSFVLISICFFPSQVWANKYSKKTKIYKDKVYSTAIIPYPHSSLDEAYIFEASDALRKELQKRKHIELIDKSKVEKILDYHYNQVKKVSSPLASGEKYLAQAKQDWFKRKYSSSEENIKRAIEHFKDNPRKGDFLLEAYVTQIQIHKERKEYQKLQDLFQEILKINPHLSLDELPISGRSKQVFRSAKKDLQSHQMGSLHISTDPPAMEVYINGIRKGVSPIEINDLPEASYLLSLEGNNYEDYHERLYVSALSQQNIHKKMKWQKKRDRKKALDQILTLAKTDDEVQREIKLATEIGKTLKVDKVILLSSEKKYAQDMLVLRTIDTHLEASHNPVAIPFVEMQQAKKASLASVTSTIDQQNKKRVLNNPQQYIEPDIGDVKILRRKRPFTKSPAFYSILGLLVAGGIGAGLYFGLKDDDEPSSPAGDVGALKIKFD